MSLQPELLVATVHRADCVFGTGFYRLSLRDGGTRYCQNTEEVEYVHSLLGQGQVERVERDGYCLDGDRLGDANTPDVVDAEWWLGLSKEQAMREVGLEREADYAKVCRDVEAAVARRDNRQRQGGVHASVVIKRRGRHVIDVPGEGEGSR